MATKHVRIISKQQRLSQARDIGKIVYVNNEQKMPKDWNLWHAIRNFPIARLMGAELNKLSPVLKIAFYPRQSRVPNTIVSQFMVQYLWLLVSNAVDRSNNMPKVDSFLSITEDMLLIKSIKANAGEWSLRNPNCFEYKTLCKFINLVSRLKKLKKKAGRIDISL